MKIKIDIEGEEARVFLKDKAKAFVDRMIKTLTVEAATQEVRDFIAEMNRFLPPS